MSFVLRGFFGVLILGLWACATKAPPAPAVIDPDAVSVQPRLFEPVSLEVHPFSSVSFDRRDRGWVLEARLRLLDRLEDVTKSDGVVRLELYDVPAVASKAEGGRRQGVWEAPLHTLNQHRRHYDPITRTYVFRLKLDRRPAPRVRLVAQFTHLNGQRMMSERVFDADLNVPETTPAP